MGQRTYPLGRINLDRCEALNFRSSKTYQPKNIIGVLHANDRFDILDYSADKNWTKIRFDGVVGYVVSDYISVAKVEDT